jgi:hypothetical protein
MGRRKKQYLICKRDYITYVEEENLLQHGFTPEQIKQQRPGEYSWNIFVSGERYECTDQMDTMSGDKIVFVDSGIKIHHRSDNMTISEQFYVNEFNKNEVDKWENDVKKYDHLPDQIKKDFPSFFNTPRKNPVLGDYFVIDL